MTGVYGSCEFPTCPREASTRNRAQQPTCGDHRLVVVGGSWMSDKHGVEAHG